MSADGGLFILSNMREFGGAERSLAALVPHLAEALPLRVFIENERHRAQLAALEHPRVSLVSMPCGNSPVALFRALVILHRELRAAPPRAVLANGHKGALLLALIRPFAPRGLRCGVYVRDFAFTTMPLIAALLRDARFFAPSGAVFEHPPYLHAGLTRRAHEVIPNAVVPADHGAASEENFIGCCARLVPWKGIDFLLRAFAQIAAEFPATNVRVFGEPVAADYVAALHRLVDELQLAGRVEFHDFEPDLNLLYRGLFYVVSSISQPPGPETFGRVVIEAWSRSKPVIAFRCGGPARLIVDGDDGWLVPERDVNTLAARMAELLRDPARRRAMGARGLARTRAEFSPPIIAERLLTSLLAP